MSSTALKLLALCFMLIDHIGGFIPGSPLWLRWIGRLAAPIFTFCVAESMAHTSNRRIYMLRMYICYILMHFGNKLVYGIMHYERPAFYNLSQGFNMFGTLLAGCIIIAVIEYAREQKSCKAVLVYLMVQIFPFVVVLSSYAISLNANLVASYNVLDNAATWFMVITDNMFMSEGAMPFVILVPVLYFTRRNKCTQAKVYILWSLYYIVFAVTNIGGRICMYATRYLSEVAATGVHMLVGMLGMQTMPKYQMQHFWQITDCRWLVIFAIIFILMYNGKKGRGMKYLFYIFYPAHIYLLYIIGCMMK